MKMCICGIDPGINGAAAFFFETHPNAIAAEDLPVVDRMLDAATLARRLEQMKPDLVVIEQVAAMPKQGVSSTFRFGQAYGMTIGVVAALRIPIEYVTPGRWKKHFRLSSDKEESRARALQMWPDRPDLFARKKDHGRAEAALIARYGAEVVLKRGMAA